MNHEPGTPETDTGPTEPADDRQDELREGRVDSAADVGTPSNVLDLQGRIERPSTQHDTVPGQESTPEWGSDDTSRAGPLQRGGTGHPTRDRGAAARDAPIRLLPPDYVPLQPEQRAEAVRALTEMIMSWMRRTGRAVPEEPHDAGDSDTSDARHGPAQAA